MSSRSRRVPALGLLLALTLACGANPGHPNCREPSPEQVRHALQQLQFINPACSSEQGALFPWGLVDAREARSSTVRNRADALAADALGVSRRDYRLMQMPRVHYVQACDGMSCFLWVCTRPAWKPLRFQTASATATGSADYSALELTARQQCRVDLASQLLPNSSIDVAMHTNDDGTLTRAIRETMHVTDKAIAIRYSNALWEGSSVLHVGCWIDMSGM